ncbi:MAG: hypothetical protein NVS4B11_07160 [Ktedonobacteraceae bacterium]
MLYKPISQESISQDNFHSTKSAEEPQFGMASAIALLLNLCKQVSVSERILRSGQPFPALPELTPGLEVAGAVLGLVGLGRIGSRVATIARVLGMQVLAFDPFIAPEHASALGVALVPTLTELLPHAHVVSLHCPSLPETYHIINAETLSLMPRESYLINVARGALIDEAALDVFNPEPPMANHLLFMLSNTICTPHIGSYTRASVLRMQVMACEQIVSALRGERPTNLVNRAVWSQP